MIDHNRLLRIRIEASRRKAIPTDVGADGDLRAGEAEEKAYYIGAPPDEPSPDEIAKLIDDVHGRFHAERAGKPLDDIKEHFTRNIFNEFGLGSIAAVYDRTGGNVDTVHNVRKGIYATDRERTAYENRGDYDSTSVHGDERYRQANRKTDAGVEDIYTGNPLRAGEAKELDHIKSAKETHDDPGRVLAGLKTPDLANMPENMGPTSRTLNRSKGSKSIDDFVADLPRNISNREARNAELEAKGDLTRHDADKLRNLREFDPQRARERDLQARTAQDKTIERSYYTSPKFLTNTVSATALEFPKMGLQQGLGLMLAEFFAACVDEIKLIFTSAKAWNRKKEEWKESFWKKLARALKRIKDRASRIVLSANGRMLWRPSSRERCPDFCRS